ncbi:uncharacterized protein V6R79_012225 [Siganus canaliculatus]
MSADDFQTKYASVMESMLKSAVAETTKLFETMVNELKAEISQIKKENEDLKAKCNQFEGARSRPCVYDGLAGRSETTERRDVAVQCDPVSFRALFIEQCQPLRKPQCNHEIDCILQEHNYETREVGTSQRPFLLVKHESILKQEEVESSIVCSQVLNDNADITWISSCGIECEGPCSNNMCSTSDPVDVPCPQEHQPSEVAVVLPVLETFSGLCTAQKQSSEVTPMGISLRTPKDDLEKLCEVSQRISIIGVQGSHTTCTKHRLVVDEKEQSVATQHSQREGIMTVNNQIDVGLQQYEALKYANEQLELSTQLDKRGACEELQNGVAEGKNGLPVKRRRGRPPKKAKHLQLPVKDMHHSPSADGPTEREDKTVPTIRGVENEFTCGSPPPLVQHKDQSVPLQDAMLFVEAMNQSMVENSVPCPLQSAAAPPQKLPTPQQHTDSLSDRTTSSVPPSTVATQTSVQSLKQYHPCPLVSLVASGSQSNVVPHPIIAVLRTTSSELPQKQAQNSLTQYHTVSSVVATQTTSGSSATSLPLRMPFLSSVTQKTVPCTSSKSLVTHSATTSTNHQPRTILHPTKATIPRQASAVPPTKRQSQTTVLTSPQVATVATKETIGTYYVSPVFPKLIPAVCATVRSQRASSSSLNTSLSTYATPAFQNLEQRLSAVVRLTRLPFPVSTTESVLVSRLPQSDGTVQEKPSFVISSDQSSEMPVLPPHVRSDLQGTSAPLDGNTWVSENLISPKNSFTLKEEPLNSEYLQTSALSTMTPSSFETTVAANTVGHDSGEPTFNLVEEMISVGVQSCILAAGQPIEDSKSDPVSHQTQSTPGDAHDHGLQMAKDPFIRQLAVSLAAKDPKERSSNDAVDARTSCAETSGSKQKKLQNKSVIAQLRSHIKTLSEGRRTQTNDTEANAQPHPELKTMTINPPKSRLESHHPNNENTTSELFPLSSENTGLAEEITSLEQIINGPTHIGPRRTGQRKDGDNSKSSVMESSYIRSTSCKESSPGSHRNCSSSRDDVGTSIGKSAFVSPRRCSSKSDVSPRCFNSMKENATPEKIDNSSVHLTLNSSTKDGVHSINKTFGSSISHVETLSGKFKRKGLCTGDTCFKKSRCTSVSPRSSSLRKLSTSPESYTSARCRRSAVAKDGSTTDPNTKGSNTFSPRRYGTNTDVAGTRNAKSAKALPKMTRDSIPVKKSKLSQDGSRLRNNLRAVNAKKLTAAAKARKMAKIKKSSTSKFHKRVRMEPFEGNQATCEAQKCAAKSAWSSPKTPVHLPIKETRSPRSQSHPAVYPPSVSLHPIPVKAPPVVSPLQPLSVIGRRLLKNQCGECGRVLSSSAALESHVSLHTGRRPFSCTLCGKRFTDPKGLKRHGRVHRNGRIHVCQQCGKGFVYRFGLTKHQQMVHSRIKPFVCQICNKGFFTKLDVEAHIRIHTGEKPFHCNLCEKKFTRRVELNVHLRWHNGEKRHWCPYCGKGFLDFNNLKRHKYIHTGEKPHSCPHCPKQFTQSGHLKKHVKNVHKIQ